MDETLQTKICTKCGQTKPLDAFNKNKIFRDGRHIYCRACMSIASKDYYRKNKERVDSKQAVYRANHKPQRCEYLVNYREKNRAKEKAAKAIYYQNKRVEILTKNALWRKNNPDIAVAIRARRKAKQANAPMNDLSVAQWKEILEHFDYRCVYCPPDCKACKKKTHKLSQDHITPFNDQGSHTLWNVVPACAKHNSQKHTGPVLNPVQPLLLTEALPYKPKRKKKGS